MIFVTVGGELPFDRLVRAMDGFAAAHPGEDVLAQIGAGGFEPAHMRWQRTLERAAYAAALDAAELVVAHAGIGSVLSAGEPGKPIVLMPRRARLGEHRNDHQRDTVAHLAGRPGLFVADDEAALPARIAAARAAPPRPVALADRAPAPASSSGCAASCWADVSLGRGRCAARIIRWFQPRTVLRPRAAGIAAIAASRLRAVSASGSGLPAAAAASARS